MINNNTYINFYQRQIVLNSSIIDKPEYIILKGLLERHERVTQSTLEKDILIDNETKDIVIHAFNEIYKLAKDEWVAIGNNDTGDLKCSLCNEPTKLIFYIKNTINGKTLNVGSYCIQHFPNCKKKVDGESISSIKSKHLKNYNLVKRKVAFGKEYGNLDILIIKYTTLLEQAPILLSQNLYEQFSQKISDIKDFKLNYLNGKLDKNLLPELQKIIDCCNDYYSNIIPSWISLHSNDKYICTLDMKKWLISNNYDEIVVKLRLNNSVFANETLPYLGYEPFIQSVLPDLSEKLSERFISIRIYEHKIFIVFNNRKLRDIPFWCFPKIFMKNFANCLLSGSFNPIDLKSCLKFFSLDVEAISYIYLLLRRLTRQYSYYNFLYDNTTRQIYIISYNRNEFFTTSISDLVQYFLPLFIKDANDNFIENLYFKKISGWKALSYLEEKKLKQLNEDNHGDDYLV